MSTLEEHENPARNVEGSGPRFWVCDLDPASAPEHAQAAGLFGPTTIGIVDELAGGIIAYAAEDDALVIIEALRSALSEV